MAEMEWTRSVPPAAPSAGWAWARGVFGRFLDWEDWLTLALLLAAIVSVSVPLENGGWTQNMPALTFVAVLAAVTTMLLTRSGLAWFYTWPLAILTGALVTFWQTLIMVGPGTLSDRVDAIYYR